MAINQKKVDALVEEVQKIKNLETKIKNILDAKESVENRQAALIEIFSRESDLITIKDGVFDNSKINALLTKFSKNEYSGVMNVLAPAAVMYEATFIVPDAAAVKKQYEESQVQLRATKEELESALFINENLRAAKQIYQEEYEKLLKENGNNKATADRLINAAVNKNQKYAERMQALTAVCKKRIADLEAQNNQDKNTAYKNGYASGQKHGKAKNWVIGGLTVAFILALGHGIASNVVKDNTIADKDHTIQVITDENEDLKSVIQKIGESYVIIDNVIDGVCDGISKADRNTLGIEAKENAKDGFDSLTYKGNTTYVVDANKDGAFDHLDFEVYDNMYDNFANKADGIKTFYEANVDLLKENADDLVKANEIVQKYDDFLKTYTKTKYDATVEGKDYSLTFWQEGTTVSDAIDEWLGWIKEYQEAAAKANPVYETGENEEGVSPVAGKDVTSPNAQNNKDSEGNELGVTDDGELSQVNEEGKGTDTEVVTDENTATKNEEEVDETTAQNKNINNGKENGQNIDEIGLGNE